MMDDLEDLKPPFAFSQINNQLGGNVEEGVQGAGLLLKHPGHYLKVPHWNEKKQSVREIQKV